MTTAAAQSHQLVPVHSISFKTSVSNGYPSSNVSRNPLARSSTHVFRVVVLKPNRSSSLNCAYQAKGNAAMLKQIPITRRKPAIAHVEVPKVAMNRPNAHGDRPLKSTAASNAVSNTLATSPKRLLASV